MRKMKEVFLKIETAHIQAPPENVKQGEQV